LAQAHFLAHENCILNFATFKFGVGKCPTPRNETFQVSEIRILLWGPLGGSKQWRNSVLPCGSTPIGSTPLRRNLGISKFETWHGPKKYAARRPNL